MGAQKAAWAVAHYLLRVIWKILHDRVRYVAPESATLDRQTILRKLKRAAADLRRVGYTVSITPPDEQQYSQT